MGSVPELELRRGARRCANDQFGGDLVLFPARICGPGKFVQGIGGDAAEQVAMDVHRREGRGAIFSQARLIKSSH